jgi:hypothetical protein
LGLSEATLDRAVQAGRVPKPQTLGGRRLFQRKLLEEFVRLGCPDAKRFAAIQAAEE